MDASVPTKYRLLYGTLYIALAAIPLPVYLFLIYVVLRNDSFRRFTCYWIMAVLGLFDCVQLCGQIYLGSIVILNAPEPHFLDKLFLAVNSFTLSGAMQMTFLLAFNRLCVITGWISAPTEFYKGCIVCSVIYVCGLIGTFLTQWAGLKYVPALLVHTYDNSLALTTFFANLDSFISAACVAFSLIFYVFTVAYLISMRFSMKFIEQTLIPKRELVILFQGIAIFLLQTILVIASLPGFSFIPNVPFVYWATGAYNFFGICATGWVNPVLYLSMNRKLRRKTREHLTFGKRVQSESVFHVPVSNNSTLQH